MNPLRASLSLLVPALLLASCGFDLMGSAASTPKMGRWTITEFTGEITETDTLCQVGTWTYKADLKSTWNLVKVEANGDFGYFLGFTGVPSSPFPDGYDHSGSGQGKSGQLTGHDVRTDLGSETTVTGTYDSTSMKASWTMQQHLGKPGECQIDVTGSGTFTAVPMD